MDRNIRILGIRNEEEEKKRIIEKIYFSIEDDIHIINSIIYPTRMDRYGLPDVWCLDFMMKEKSKKITRERRDLILNFCADIEQYFLITDHNAILSKLVNLLTTYDTYAARLGHRKNLSDACKQLLTKDFDDYSSPNIDNILKNLKSYETNEMIEEYIEPISMIFNEDALEKDTKKYLEFKDIDPDELDQEIAKFEQEFNSGKSDHGI